MRRSLAEVAGAPLRAWNTRGFVSRFVYDDLRRPTHHFVTPPSASEMLVERSVWGEDLSSPEDTNHRTRLYRAYDAAGELTNVEFDSRATSCSRAVG